MDIVIIKPSVGIQKQIDQDKNVILSFFYDSGEKIFKVMFASEYKEEINQILSNDIDFINRKKLYSEEINKLIDVLVEKEILISKNREGWLDLVDLKRYDRQLRLISDKANIKDKPEDIQYKILNTKILIVGLGGVGSNIIQQLVFMGFRNFYLVDPDKIEESNFNRQVIYSFSDISKYKVDIAEKWIRKYHTDASVNGSICTLETLIKNDIIQEYNPDLIINCADVPSILDTTNMILKSLEKAIPVVVGGGYFLFKTFTGPFIIPGKTACLMCGYQDIEKKDMDNISASGGNISSVAAMAASITSSAIFQYMINVEKVNLLNKQLVIDLEKLTFNTKEIGIDNECSICSHFR